MDAGETLALIALGVVAGCMVVAMVIGVIGAAMTHYTDRRYERLRQRLQARAAARKEFHWPTDTREK